MKFLKRHALTIATGLLAVTFIATGRVTVPAARRSIDAGVLLVLFALLIAVELLRHSGWLDYAVARTIARFHTTRGFALALIAMTGVLSALVTNDVALFVVIPFTVVASRFSQFDLEDAVILEVVAANLLGCLTPLGNPQNLFVFHRSGWSAAQFIRVMLPFTAISAAGLLAAVFLLGTSKPLVKADVDLPPRDVKGGLAGALCFALVLLEIARLTSGWPAAIAALICGIALLRRRILQIDLSIVPLFFFAFIVVAGLPRIRLGIGIFWSAVALSQVISNVPATILLSPLTADWRALLYGVNAGGCGTIIASLANLLGWRIYGRESGRDPRFFVRFTVVDCAFLAWITAGAWILLH